jgi:Flp pilus assembly protein TadD
MRFWSVPPLLASLGLFLSAPVLRAGDDPGGLFLQAYQEYQVASNLETTGKLDDALRKYRFCASLLEQIQKQDPNFNPPVIEYRLKKSRESIARVQSLSTPSQAVSVFAPSVSPPSLAPAPAPPQASLLLDVPGYRLPEPGANSASLPRQQRLQPPIDLTLPAPGEEVIGRGSLAELKKQLRAYQLRLDAERQENESLRSQLLGSKANEQSALVERDRTKAQIVEIQSQLAQTRQTLDDTQQENDRLAREKSADQKRIAGLESDLDSARADLEVANEYNGELFAKLEQAAKFIDADEKIRQQLLAERKELGSRLAAGTGQASDVEKARAAAQARVEALEQKLAASEKSQTTAVTRIDALEKQLADAAKARDAALARNELLVKQSDDSTKQLSASRDLQERLADTEKKLATLTKHQADRDKVEGELRSQLAALNQTLSSLRGQLDTGRKRIAELEKQLADTSSAAANATGAIARENALLKSLVTRELAEQARRQQARKLVEEEMDKLHLRSTTLLGKLDALTGSEVTLTPEERKLLPQAGASAASGSDFVFVVPQKKPDSDLPAELVARAQEANALSQQSRFDEARVIYEEIARKAPRSYFAAVNLGIVQRQLGDYAEAATAFQRALDLKPGDVYALTNLGSAKYRGGDLSSAIETLRKAVAADSDNYLAHYLLGTALNDNGDRDSARQEIERTLAIKPDYLPAVQLSSELEKADLSSAKTSGSAPSAR